MPALPSRSAAIVHHGVDVDEQLVGGGHRTVLGELDRRVDVGAQLGPDGVDVVTGGGAVLDQVRLEREDRIALAPHGDLVVGAVLEPEVLHAVMVVVAVRLGLDQRRALRRAELRPTASLAASWMATTSMPSTITPGMP